MVRYVGQLRHGGGGLDTHGLAVEQEIAQLGHKRVVKATGAYLGLNLVGHGVGHVIVTGHQPRWVGPLAGVGAYLQLARYVLIAEGLVGGNLQAESLALAYAAACTVVVELVAHLIHGVAGQCVFACHGAPAVVAKAVVVVVVVLHRHVGTTASHHSHSQAPLVGLQRTVAIISLGGVVTLHQCQHLGQVHIHQHGSKRIVDALLYKLVLHVLVDIGAQQGLTACHYLLKGVGMAAIHKLILLLAALTHTGAVVNIVERYGLEIAHVLTNHIILFGLLTAVAHLYALKLSHLEQHGAHVGGVGGLAVYFDAVGIARALIHIHVHVGR